jgi:transposase InsO family protein
MHNLYVSCMLSYNGKIGHLRLYDEDIAVVKFKNGETVSVSPEELEQARSDGRLQLVRSPSYNPCHITTDENQDKEIERLTAYCNALELKPHPCAKGVREEVISRISYLIGDHSPPSISHLHKIYRRWVAADKNMVQALFGKKRMRNHSIPSEVFDLMDEAIKKEYLEGSRPTMHKAYGKFTIIYRTRGYIAPCPSLSTFERRIKELDRLEVIKSRYGKSAARNEARSTNSKIEVNRILQRVELDTAHFNLGLKNDLGEFIGTPSIYFVIDVHSRIVLGYAIHVGKQSETSACVIHALRYAISSKNDPLYPYYGVPLLVVIDQGVAYIAEDTVRFFNNLKIEIICTGTKMGWGKPMVERFIGTVRTGFFQGFKGYLGKRDKSIYSDSTIKSAAKHTLGEFRKAFSAFIIQYHNQPHAGLNGRTPAEVWKESARKYPPISVDEIGHDQLLRGLREERQLKHVQGVTCDYQVFNSDELQAIYHRNQKNQKPGRKDKVKVTVYRDPLDASAISVVDPLTNRLLEVPNVLGDKISGLSFAETRLNRMVRTTAEEAPVWDDGISEGYSNPGKSRRKGPDVTLDAPGSPVDLETLLRSQVEEYAVESNGTASAQKDEDDDYAVIVK